mgnify:CR=1 FL=1
MPGGQEIAAIFVITLLRLLVALALIVAGVSLPFAGLDAGCGLEDAARVLEGGAVSFQKSRAMITPARLA